MRVVVFLAVLTGCFSKPGFDGTAGGDGGGDHDAGGSVDPNRWNDFTNPQLIQGIAGVVGSDISPITWSNDDELYFSSERASPNQVYVTTRTAGSGFDAPVLVDLGSPADGHNHGTLSEDGADLYTQSTSYLPEAFHRGAQNTWTSAPSPQPHTGPADLGAHDLRMVAGSIGNPTLPTSVIVEFARSSVTAQWETAPAPTFSPSLEGDTSPTLSADGLEMFYEAHVGNFASEIRRAIRTSLDEPFTTSTKVTLTGEKDQGDPELSHDGRTLYFRVLIGSDYRLYSATRTLK